MPAATRPGDTRRDHPLWKANIFERLTYWWLKDIVVNGLKRELKEADIYQHLESFSTADLGASLERTWHGEEKASKGNVKFRMVLIKEFGPKFAAISFIHALLEFGCRAWFPFFLGQLLAESQYLIMGRQLSAVCLLLSVGMNFVFGQIFIILMLQIGMRMNIACSYLIFRKCLRLSPQSFKKTTSGQIVNLLANDCSRLNNAWLFINFFWISPIMLVIMCYFMFVEIGWSFLSGTVLMLLLIPVQGRLVRKNIKNTIKTATHTDNRLKLMNEIIKGIRVIKMYAWEKSFAKLVAGVRRIELKYVRKSSIFKAINSSFLMFSSRFCLLLTIVTYIVLGNELTAKKAFVVTSCFEVLRTVVSDSIPIALSQIGNALVAIHRIEQFLLLEETENSIVDSGEVYKRPGVQVTDVFAKWTWDDAEYCLKSLSFEASSPKLVGIIGQVGSGKSSFFNLILNEVKVLRGTTSVSGTVSYAPQEPWIFSGTVQENVLLGEELDVKRYRQIIEICQLEPDLSTFPNGDQSLVGEKGITLSGGQRARIGLARALYKKAEIYLLDDPLSAVDTHVGNMIFKYCIKEFLRNTLCILITHQLQYVKDTDEILIFESGEITQRGGYVDLLQGGVNFDIFAKPTEPTDRSAAENESKSKAKSKALSNNRAEELPKEQQTEGQISLHTFASYFNAFGGTWKIVMVVAIFVVSQIFSSGSNYFLSSWTSINRAVTSDLISLLIYVGFAMAGILISVASCIFLYKICIRVSQVLHDKMFRSIIGAPVTFFIDNPSGRIMNRFTKDIMLVDEIVPMTIADLLRNCFGIVGVFVVITILNPTLIVLAVSYTTVTVGLTRIFVPVSRSLRRVLEITRSPVISHLNSCLQGLASIRAQRAAKNMQLKFTNYLNVHNSVAHLNLCCTRAFGFWLDFFSLGFTFVIILLFFSDADKAKSGLAIVESVSLMAMATWGVRMAAEFINSMTSVERIMEYANIEQEEEEPPEKDNFNIYLGGIAFENVTLKYSPTGDYVLNNINLKISPREKIGIVGRTGAGKSSLVAVLFKLFDFNGTVLLDGTNTKTVGLQELRSKISIIPQEPFIFSGTIRENIDPFSERPDQEVWKALEEVTLKNHIEELPMGLSTKVTDTDGSFSTGQKQLICLARAIVNDNKVLVMDEATSNVDQETDALVQKKIRERFRNCTVVTIAHRLHTIIDCDRIVVMESGRVVEFDRPNKLLQNKNGHFFEMVREAGKDISKELMQIAMEKSIASANEYSFS